ncbi:MAG: glycoside hydrolase family 32 protein [Eubacteriales bacterium]
MNQHQKNIEKAMNVIKNNKDVVALGKFRQKFHLMPEAGWMNDPNGFCYYKGKYHLFYQANPYSSNWGSMHWAHAVSEDLSTWTHLPIALAPSEAYDQDFRGGCFSGNCIVVEDRLYVMYTGAIVKENKHIQQQCLAYSDDGVIFHKYENNPVITPEPHHDPSCFRDPKVFLHNETYYCIIGSSINQDGTIELYKSKDLKSWDYCGILCQGDKKYGYMWECPDFFPLGDKYVLVVSPMGLGEKQVVYFTGDMDFEKEKFTIERSEVVDFGFDFYAPQTVLSPDGESYMIGWQNSWAWMPWFQSHGPSTSENWCGSMSIPRKIKLKEDGSLAFTPADSVKKLFSPKSIEKEMKISEKSNNLNPDSLEQYHLSFQVDTSGLKTFSIELCASSYERTLISVNMEDNIVTYDRAQGFMDAKGKREIPLHLEENAAVRFEIFLDTSNIEFFINDGLIACSNNTFHDKSSTELYFTGNTEFLVKNFQLSTLSS